MRTPPPRTDERTRQFLLSMCAQAQSHWAAQSIVQAPLQAAQAHTLLSMQAVLDLLQD